MRPGVAGFSPLGLHIFWIFLKIGYQKHGLWFLFEATQRGPSCWKPLGPQELLDVSLGASRRHAVTCREPGATGGTQS